MDQVKVGKFIAYLRKEKKMTQEMLAEKLGVSINAVSKWERGLSFPDVSLYKKLCNELDISIEELINGEKDKSEEAKEKAIITALEEKNNIKKISNKKIISLILLFAFIITGLLFYSKNLKVNLVNDSDKLYDIAINYLREEEFKNNRDSNKQDFNVFFSYHGFGIEKKEDYKFAYMWIYNQSYFVEEKDALAISKSFSMPIKVTFKNDNVVKVDMPLSGNRYASSVRKIFPNIIASQVLNFDNEKNINKLYNDILTRKNKYYDYLKFDMSKITIDDISYNDIIFNIWIGNKTCTPVELSVLKNNKYILYTAYEECKPNQNCNDILKYTKSINGIYNYDVIQIIKHSEDANNLQFTNNLIPKYEIYGGNGYMFITGDDNKYLTEFLKQIDVDLTKCAEPDYID